MFGVSRGGLAGRLFSGGVLMLVACASDWAARSHLRVWVARYWDEALVVSSWVVTGVLWLRVREMRREREEFFRRFVDVWSEVPKLPARKPAPGEKVKG